METLRAFTNKKVIPIEKVTSFLENLFSISKDGRDWSPLILMKFSHFKTALRKQSKHFSEVHLTLFNNIQSDRCLEKF